MNDERIEEIQNGTKCSDSISVRAALNQVWSECGNEKDSCSECDHNSLRVAMEKAILNTTSHCDDCRLNPKFTNKFAEKRPMA